MFKNKISKSLVFGLMALVGLGSGVAIMASAQSATTTPVVVPANTTLKAQTIDTPEVGDVPDVAGAHVDKANDSDGSAASEANEGTGSSDLGE